MSEVRVDHLSDVLRVGEVQGCIHLIQDVYRGGFEEEHGQNEGQGHQRSDNTAQPYIHTQLNSSHFYRQ